jgi:hypothetical protein
VNPSELDPRPKNRRTPPKGVDRPTSESAAIDPRQRLKKLRQMLGEVTGPDLTPPPPER